MTRILSPLAPILATAFFSNAAWAEDPDPAEETEALSISYAVGFAEGVKARSRVKRSLKKSLYLSLKKSDPDAKLSRGKANSDLPTCLASETCAVDEGVTETLWVLKDSLLLARVSADGVESLRLFQGKTLKSEQEHGRLRLDDEGDCKDSQFFVDGVELSCSVLMEPGLKLDPGAHVLISRIGEEENSRAFLIKAAETTELSRSPIQVLSKMPTTPTPKVEEKKRTLRLAVYDFDAGDIDPAINKIFQAALVTELRKRQWLSVVSTSEIRAMLKHEADKQLLGCSDDTSCMSEIADALGVDALLVGSMAKVGDTNVLTLKRISQREASVKGSVQRNVPADKGHGLLGEVGSVVDELFPQHALRPGAERGAAELFSERLSPPPLPKWVFYSATSVTTLAAFATGATAGALFINDNTRTTAEDIPESAFGNDEAIREIQEEVVTGESTNRSLLIGTTVAVGVTLTAAVTAGIFALLTDFDDEPDLDLDD